MLPIFYYINEQTLLYCLLCALVLACFRACLMRIPYATILSTLVSTCGLIIGLAAIIETTTLFERMSMEILRKNYIFLNDLKIAYIFAALFIIVVIIFNLLVGFIATDMSLYKTASTSQRSRQCCPVTCMKSSTAIFLLQIFLAFNYVIYFALLLVTILSFIGLYSTYVMTVLCNEGPAINYNVDNHAKIATDFPKVLDLRQFSPLLNLKQNETYLMRFEGQSYQKLCADYVRELYSHIILCSVGFLLSTVGFVNYLINFSVNSAKISTKQKFTELIYLNSEFSAFDSRY